MELNEGCRSVFLSTCGRIRKGVSEELILFLEFVKADLGESQSEFEDDFVKQLQASVEKVKSDREMAERLILFHKVYERGHCVSYPSVS